VPISNRSKRPVGRSKISSASCRAASLLVAVVLVSSLPGCLGPQDPRAYPDSVPGRSLSQISADYSVKLPTCNTIGLRYYVTDDMSSTFYLMFTSNDRCVQDFLASAGLSGASATVYANPFGAYEEKKFGWKFPTPCKCTFYLNASSVRETVDVAVDSTVYRSQHVFLRLMR
jgi:hypothetical protein